MLFSNAARLLTILSTSGVAASVTVGMLIFNRNDKPVTKEVSEILTNIEVQADEFQKQQYFYSKDGTNDGKVSQITPEEYEKIKEVLEGKRQLVQSEGPSGGEQQPSGNQNDGESIEASGDNGISTPTLSVQQPQSREGAENLDAQELNKSVSGNDSKDSEVNQHDSAQKENTEKTDLDVSKEQTDGKGEDGLDSDKSMEEDDKVESNLVKNQEQDGKNVDLVDQEEKESNKLSKTTDVRDEQADHGDQKLTSDEAGSGLDEDPENCKPCPKNKKDTQDPTKGEELDQKNEENRDTVTQIDHDAQQKKTGESDSESKGADNTHDSDSENSSKKDNEGVLDDGANSSLLTSEEQLRELEDLYGKVGSVLSQLNSKIDL